MDSVYCFYGITYNSDEYYKQSNNYIFDSYKNVHHGMYTSCKAFPLHHYDSLLLFISNISMHIHFLQCSG